MLLDAARERVQKARPRVRRETFPRRQCGTRGSHRRVDVGLAALGDARNDLRRRRVRDLEQLPRLGPRAADVMAEDALVLP
jgi:hypothetical protein